MKRHPLPPNAPLLLESMRAIGYDAATAIADLVDNSISAGASEVDILFSPGRPEDFSILDNGRGMDMPELLVAMRHGSRSPAEHRDPTDLGRFGLGLKTASMSQCRRLTVATRRSGRTIGMEWDLDEVGSDWEAGVLEPSDFEELPHIEKLEALSSGTLVVWRKLDVIAGDDPGDGSVIGARVAHVRDHLALVFHRFLSEGGRPLCIRINRNPLQALDPFLRGLGSIAGPEERISVGEHFVLLRAYTLPHISRLTVEQIATAGGELGLRKLQGFYVYRNRRLIIWGTWFRMFRQEELTKLTRVQVDVPSTLDGFWRLDIKKSAASPPESIRERLRSLVPRLAGPSKRATEYRARVSNATGQLSIWNRMEAREGVYYVINHEHPLISALRAAVPASALRDLDVSLRAISDALPVDAIYLDGTKDHRLVRNPATADELEEHLEDLARQILEVFETNHAARNAMLAQLGNLEPFAGNPDITQRLKERLAAS